MIEGTTTEKVKIDTEEKIINLIEKSLNDPFNKKKKPKQILEELGFHDTITLLDERSRQLFDLYQFYKYSPHECSNSYIWFDAYNTISEIEEHLKPRLF